MFALLRKEIDSFLNSLIGYVVILVFLLSIGLFLWIFPGTEFNLLENGYANPVSYTHLRAHETVLDIVCRLLLEKKKETKKKNRLPT